MQHINVIASVRSYAKRIELRRQRRLCVGFSIEQGFTIRTQASVR